jgi:PAS domain S-box-containing protein
MSEVSDPIARLDPINFELTEKELRQFVAATPVLISVLRITEQGFQLAWMSDNLRSVTGWSGVEKGKWNDWWIENIHPEDRPKVLESQSILCSDEHQELEYRFRRPEGSYLWIRDQRKLQRNHSVRPDEVIGTWTDISERKHLENQLAQAQKMEAIGVLAGGIAHDFNNMLTIIKGYTEVVLDDLAPDSPYRPDLEEVLKAGKQATSLTAQILAFSRKQVLQPAVLNLNDTVAEMRTMLCRLIGEDIELSTVTQPDLELISADPGQLQQIVMNLAVNAREAMPHGGKLNIATRTVCVDDVFRKLHPSAKANSYVMLEISDNGIGMDAVTQARIFDPFFTTKEIGRGTGLGMSIVYGIVSQSDGFISVQSEPGIGSTFRIFFPRAPRESIDTKDQSKMQFHAKESETVLLVEDEASVRTLAARILRAGGYNVIEASNGKKALDVIQAYSGKIHLVITDVIMPEMNGVELSRRMQAARPDIKALYVSGYTSDEIVSNGMLDSKTAFLQKPFTILSLLHKVREAICA